MTFLIPSFIYSVVKYVHELFTGKRPFTVVHIIYKLFGRITELTERVKMENTQLAVQC
jgi:hypothetical protein